ncbi:hypothetical protein EVAR_44897_1 [Eumeta japonica]|uniref:Uncharacterized protein n=1 Tax=Eumeta variegata TaxID=151549 RepID=A0A4C1XIS3_EUMVA|nr:hypothetical protein EVAR_44897_1 [Eumeta japonica]
MSAIGIENGLDSRIENGARIRIESEIGTELKNGTRVENGCKTKSMIGTGIENDTEGGAEACTCVARGASTSSLATRRGRRQASSRQPQRLPQPAGQYPSNPLLTRRATLMTYKPVPTWRYIILDLLY